MPAIRDDLGLSPARLGLVILALSAGAVLALPLAGAVVHRLGPRRTVTGCAALEAVALAGVGAAWAVPVLVGALFLVGVSSGTWDVAMNVAAADVEQRLGRPIMPRFHAGWSLGTVTGAAVGALAAAVGLPVRIHLPLVAVLGAAALLPAATRILPAPGDPAPGDPAPGEFVPGDPAPGDPAPAEFVPGESVPGESAPSPAGPGEPGRVGTGPVRRRRSGTLAAWRERRTLGIGLLVLGMAFCEGTANDWLAVGIVDGYRTDHAIGAAGFGLFVAAMTAGRMVGPAAIVRYGRILTLRGGAGLILLGVLLLVGAPVLLPGRGAAQVAALALAAVGALAWGCGASLGFPIGMSAAADDPARAAGRISVVASIGYTAFLAGPPLLGLLGDQVGTLRAQLGVLLAVGVVMVTAGVTRVAPASPITRVG